MVLIYTHIFQITIVYVFETQMASPQSSSLARSRNDSTSAMYMHFRVTVHAYLMLVAIPCFHGYCKELLGHEPVPCGSQRNCQQNHHDDHQHNKQCFSTPLTPNGPHIHWVHRDTECHTFPCPLCRTSYLFLFVAHSHVCFLIIPYKHFPTFGSNGYSWFET
jgi:hypothetical protein